MAAHQQTIYALFVINKAGGLIYHQDFSPVAKKLGNDYLRMASTFHALHVMAMNINPTPVVAPTGISTIETAQFRLECLKTQTGTKFFIVTDPDSDTAAKTLREIYILYTDYVLKNPFYLAEMPIRCELFDVKLLQLIQERSGAFRGPSS